MPILNPNKCYAQQKMRLKITVPETPPDNWLPDFYELLSAELQLDDEMKHEVFDRHTEQVSLLTEKERFFKELDRIVGEQSTYALKTQLLESLCALYYLFKHPETTDEQKQLIASRIKEDVDQCSPGFTNRVNYTLTRFNMPENMDELIAQVRFNLVDRIAGIIAAKNPQGVHVHNRVIEVARIAGFGVWPINKDDVYSDVGSKDLSDEDIVARLKTDFANHFQLFGLVNLLCDELEALIAPHGYLGKNGLETGYKNGAYEKFYECLSLFTHLPIEALLEIDTESGKITNINWQNVKRRLLERLRDENYVTLSPEEATLLDGLLPDENNRLDLKALNTLILHGYELVQFLEFVSLWSIEQKATLVRAILHHKSPDAQKEILAILHNEAPQLTALLKKEPHLQAIYFAIAIAEKDVNEARTYVEQGADINKALPLLFSEAHKSDTLYWLYEHPHLLQKLTVEAMSIVIDEGKYQGKTLAETLVSTKKGRQLLLESDTLQALLAKILIADKLSDALSQAKIERMNVSTQEGFFKKSSPLANQLGQHIVYGELPKSEALLKANPSLLETLLREKVTVIDYSRRKVKQKTAFQAALCAMDDELCAMLANYMSEEEVARQYQDIFPEGHEKYYQEQKPFDFSNIVETISQSNDEELQKALDLESLNDTPLWKNLEKFREDFTKHSSQEVVFNPQHLLKAFALYDSEYGNWSSKQRDLFWQQVIGYVQRFLPANIAMDFAQGLYDRVEGKEKSARSFKFKYGRCSIFPLAFDSFSGLGYGYAARGSGCARPGAVDPYALEVASCDFQNLCRAKTVVLGELYNQRSASTISVGV